MADKRKENKQEISTNKIQSLLHESLHTAILKSDLSQVLDLIIQGVPVCHENKSSLHKNCYILAQDNLNPEYLRVLLEYDSSGVNQAVDNSPKDSLLMRDIKYYNCRHFQLLLNKGADVNYSNQCCSTALHYAAHNEKTPIDVFKKLIQLSANVNKNVEGITPLSLLVSSGDTIDILEKVHLLVEAGAEVNVYDNGNETPLMLAAGYYYETDSIGDTKYKLIKYLLDHGAKAGIVDRSGNNALSLLMRSLLHDDDDYTEKELTEFVEKCYIPGIDLLFEAGDDVFSLNSSDRNFPSSAFGLLVGNSKLYIKKVVLHLLKLGLNKLANTNIKINDNFQLHPLKSIIRKLCNIIEDDAYLREIVDIILSYPLDEFKNFRIDYGWYIFRHMIKESNLSIIGVFAVNLSFKQVTYYLVEFIEHNFDPNRKDPLIYFLLRRFANKNTKSSKHLVKIIDYLINKNYKVNRPLNWYDPGLCLYNPYLGGHDYLIKKLNVPVCLWISAAHGNIECLKKLLPYWNQPPLAIIICLSPWLRTDEFKNMLKSINIILPFLSKNDGPISHGTNLHKYMKSFILNCQIKTKGGRASGEINPVYVSDIEKEYRIEYKKITNYLMKLHESPASLKVMCRTVIRANAVGHGNNLPNYLASLVPYGLKKFLTCNFN